MNILFIAPLPGPLTGQSLACRVLLDELRRSHSVDVVDLSKAGLTQGVDSFSRIVRVFEILREILRKRRAAELIYFTVSESLAGNLKDLLIYALCFDRLSRMAIHLHGGAGLARLMLGPRGPRRRLNEFLLRRIGCAIVLGKRHIRVFENAVTRDRIRLAPNFAQDEFFESEDRIRQKFAAVDRLRILFLSNLIPGKGHDELLEAFLGLPAETRAGIELDFAGGFESEAQKDAFLARLSGVAGARHHGVVTGAAKQRLLSRAHLFCLPTYYPYEGQPISILEAYASGCAVATTDHSGIFDVFTPGVNGYAIRKRSVEDLRALIERLRRDPSPLLGMALANSRQADAEHRTSVHCARLVRILEDCAAEAPRGVAFPAKAPAPGSR